MAEFATPRRQGEENEAIGTINDAHSASLRTRLWSPKRPQGHANIDLSHRTRYFTCGRRGHHSTSVQATHSSPHRPASCSRSRYDPHRAANCSAAPASVGPCPPDAISTSPANAGRAGAVSMQGIIKRRPCTQLSRAACVPAASGAHTL